jgi:pantoate--beta-alanine ligase
MTEYSLPVVQTVAQLRKQIALFKQNKYSEDITPTVGFVPTMGALHSGHCALIKRSAKKCAITVVSIL